MDGTDYQFIQKLEQLRVEQKTTNKLLGLVLEKLQILTEPQVEVHHIGRQRVVHNRRCNCDKCTRPIEPKT